MRRRPISRCTAPFSWRPATRISCASSKCSAATRFPAARSAWSRRSEAERRQYLAQVRGEHRLVAEAIAAGDPEAARAAMRRHLEAARERYRRLAAQAGG
jgi:DNA-binding FadR family transcriptional regulator